MLLAPLIPSLGGKKYNIFYYIFIFPLKIWEFGGRGKKYNIGNERGYTCYVILPPL